MQKLRNMLNRSRKENDSDIGALHATNNNVGQESLNSAFESTLHRQSEQKVQPLPRPTSPNISKQHSALNSEDVKIAVATETSQRFADTQAFQNYSPVIESQAINNLGPATSRYSGMHFRGEKNIVPGLSFMRSVDTPTNTQTATSSKPTQNHSEKT